MKIKVYMKLIGTILLVVFIGSLSTAYSKDRRTVSFDATPYNEFGQRFTGYLVERNLDKVDKLIDLDTLAKRISKVVFDDAAMQKGFVDGFVDQMSEKSFATRMIASRMPEGTTVAYLGINSRGEPTVRLDYPEAGYDYIGLILDKGAQGDFRIADFVFASAGELASVSIGNATKYFSRPSESILKRLLGGIEPDPKLINDFQKIIAFRNEGKFQQGYDLLQTIPEQIRNQKELILFAIELAINLGEERHNLELARFAKYYGNDPKNTFMLVDHYIVVEDWAKAVSAINTTKEIWSDDGALNAVLASIYNMSGDMDEAIKAAEYANQVEPDFEEGYWVALEQYVKTGQFDKSITKLEILKNKFKRQFTAEPLADDSDYIGLAKSDVYLAWLNK